jgi:2Fe-2S ferredoxin
VTGYYSQPAARFSRFRCITIWPKLGWLPRRMPKVTYIQPDGVERVVDVRAGTTAMEAAVDNDVAGIVAECGGACSCATCHVYVDPAWASRLPPPDPQENGMLECVLDRRDTSRLSCQIVLTPELDGLVLRVADEQI